MCWCNDYVCCGSDSPQNLFDSWTVAVTRLIYLNFRIVNVKSDITIMWCTSLYSLLLKRLYCFNCCSTWSSSTIPNTIAIFLSSSATFNLHNWTLIRIHCDWKRLLRFNSNAIRHALFSLNILHRRRQHQQQAFFSIIRLQ